MGGFGVGPDFILKGYLARQELQQRAQQLAQEHQQAQDLLQFHYKQLDQNYKQNKERTDLLRLQVRDQMQQHLNEIMGMPDEALMPQSAREQFAPSQQISAQQPQQTTDTQTGQTALTPNIQTNLGFQQAKPWQYSTPEMQQAGISPVTIDPYYQKKMADVMANQEYLKSKAKAEGEEPTELKKIGALGANQQALEAKRAADAQALQKLRDVGLDARWDRRNQTTLDAARIHADAMIKAKQMGQDVDPDEVTAEYWAATTGKAPLPTNAKHRAAVLDMMKDNGTRVFNDKEAADLNSMHNMDGIFQDMQDLVNKIPDGWKGNVKSFLESKSPLATQLSNQLDAIAARAPVAARALFGIDKGRLTNMEVSSAKQALAKGGIGRDTGGENISRLQRDFNNKIWEDKLGGMTVKQKAQVLKDNGFGGQFKASIKDNNGNIIEGNAEDIPDLPAGSKVFMQAPDGKSTGYIDASNIEDYAKKGFKLAYVH